MNDPTATAAPTGWGIAGIDWASAVLWRHTLAHRST